MIPAPLPAPREALRAFDSVWVEYETVWLKPRLVFDDLTRTAFDACAEICNDVMRMRRKETPAQQCPRIRCDLPTDGPGSYLLSFEIPDEERVPPEARSASLMRRRRSRQTARGGSRLDAGLQLELHSATRILEEMLLAVDIICSTPAGQLGASMRSSGHGSFVEFVNGIRVLQDIHRDSWRALRRPEILDPLRRAFAPFRDPELHTMSVRGIPQEGSLGSSWVITATRRLREFADGGPLELPPLERTMLETHAGASPDRA